MKLYARICDPNGLEDGKLEGYVMEVVPAEDLAELETKVGADLMWQMVEAPNAQCALWRYEGGQFIEPEA